MNFFNSEDINQQLITRYRYSICRKKFHPLVNFYFCLITTKKIFLLSYEVIHVSYILDVHYYYYHSPLLFIWKTSD